MRRSVAYTLLCLGLLVPHLFTPAVAAAADPLVHNDYGVTLLVKGDIDKAIEQLETAYGLSSSDQTLKGNLATAYALRGQRLLDRKSYTDAAGQFEKALVLFPDEPRYHLLRGIAYTLAKNFSLARYELQQARTLGGDTAEGLYFLGRLHYEEGETDEALQYWEKAAALAPSDPFFEGLLERMRREQAVETRMERGHSSRFVISYDTGEVRTGIVLKVLDVLETAYNSVGTDLGYFPEARVPVILYTKRDYREVTRSPDWSGGLFDGKIRLPIGGLAEISPQLRATLRHEYTHAVVRELTRGNCPVWLNEGIAELQGRQELNAPLVELGKVVKTGEYLPFRHLEKGFASLGHREVLLAYEQSYALVNFMVSGYGWHRLRAILTNLGEAMTMDQAISNGLVDLGLNYDGVLAEWQEYMEREYGGERK